MDEFEFNELIKEFLTAYRQFLLCAYMYKDVTPEIYNRTKPTWDTIIKSLDSGPVLGLAKIFEKDKNIGRPFNDTKLDSVRDRILNLRQKRIAHFDSSTLREPNIFLERNHLLGPEGLSIFEALKNRFLNFQESYKFKTDVASLFRQTTDETVRDFNNWLSVFRDQIDRG